jgi:outer membrane protein TolC
VVAADAQVAAAEAQVGSAWARLAPQLSASGAAFAADVPYPTGKKQGWRATLDLTWPLYDGGFRYGKRREADARLAGARSSAQLQRLAIGQEVRDALHDVEVAAERLRLAGEQQRLAEEADGTARRGYQAGVASSLDVVDADDRLYLAEAGLAEARARHALARIGLERALGRGP